MNGKDKQLNEHSESATSGLEAAQARYRTPQLVDAGSALSLIQAKPEGGYTDSINLKKKAQGGRPRAGREKQ